MTPEEIIQQAWPQIRRATNWARILMDVPAEKGQTRQVKIAGENLTGQIIANAPQAGHVIVDVPMDKAIRYLVSCPRLDAISEILDGAERLAAKI